MKGEAIFILVIFLFVMVFIGWIAFCETINTDLQIKADEERKKNPVSASHQVNRRLARIEGILMYLSLKRRHW